MTLPAAQPVAFANWEAPVLEITMSPATPVAGWTFLLNVRDNQGNLLLRSSSYTVTDALLGVVEFPITSDQVGLIGTGIFRFDIWRVDSGSEKRLARGPMSIDREEWK